MFGRGRRAEKWRSDGFVKNLGEGGGFGGGLAAALWVAGAVEVDGVGSRAESASAMASEGGIVGGSCCCLTSLDGSGGAVTGREREGSELEGPPELNLRSLDECAC